MQITETVFEQESSEWGVARISSPFLYFFFVFVPLFFKNTRGECICQEEIQARVFLAEGMPPSFLFFSCLIKSGFDLFEEGRRGYAAPGDDDDDDDRLNWRRFGEAGILRWKWTTCPNSPTFTRIGVPGRGRG